MNIENKKTALNDEAALYRHKEDISEKEKWKNMSPAKRWEYFKNYYLMKLTVTLIVVIMVGSILYTMLAPKPEVRFSVAIINHALLYDTQVALQEKFEEHLGLDREIEETLFDSGYDFAYDEVNSLQKFGLYNAVGELDVTILPMSVFEEYAAIGYFAPVSEHLSTDLYVKLSDYLVECKQKDENGAEIEGSEAMYGIRLDSTWIYEGTAYDEPAVLAVNLATTSDEDIAAFLKFLFFREEGK